VTTASRPVRRWPLLLIAAPAAVAIWSGWVGLGGMCGFGLVHPLPGILPSLQVNTAITLPVGVEAYGAYALGAWLSAGARGTARTFARWSAVGALLLGMSGQVAYHLLAAWHASRAPWPVVVAVSCMPVVTLGFGAALTHLLRSEASGESGSEQSPRHELATFAAPLVSALAARIAPREATAASPEHRPGDSPDVRPEDHPASDPGDRPAGDPETRPADVTADHPAEGIAERPDESRTGTPPGIARVRRKGAVNATDDEIKTAVRELFAGAKPVTPYRVKAELKGAKGSIGDGRARKLLAEVQAERPSLHAVAK
jgi:hypothetical protein